MIGSRQGGLPAEGDPRQHRKEPVSDPQPSPEVLDVGRERQRAALSAWWPRRVRARLILERRVERAYGQPPPGQVLHMTVMPPEKSSMWHARLLGSAHSQVTGPVPQGLGMHIPKMAPPWTTEQISPGMHDGLPEQGNVAPGRVSSVPPMPDMSRPCARRRRNRRRKQEWPCCTHSAVGTGMASGQSAVGGGPPAPLVVVATVPEPPVVAPPVRRIDRRDGGGSVGPN